MNTVAPRTSIPAIPSLIFGIFAWLALPFLGALIAVITGHMARLEIRYAPAHSVEGNGMALVGLVLGYLNFLACILVAAVFTFLVSSLFNVFN